MATTIPPEVRNIVLRRDGYQCIARLVDGRAGWCRDVFGNLITRWPAYDRGPGFLQMSHTKDQGELVYGMKAPTTPEHLVTLCPWHHTGQQAGAVWEVQHRNKIRTWLIEQYGPAPRR